MKKTITVLITILLLTTAGDCNGENGPRGPVEQSPVGRYYEDCEEWKRANVDPPREDRPGTGYRDELDDNGNGIACEPGER